MAAESRNAGFTGVGTVLQINEAILSGGGGGSPFIVPLAIDYCSYLFILGTGVTGTLTFAMLGGDGTWRTFTPPAAQTWSGYPAIAASTTYFGTLSGPFIGLQVLGSLSGGSLTWGELLGTIRP